MLEQELYNQRREKRPKYKWFPYLGELQIHIMQSLIFHFTIILICRQQMLTLEGRRRRRQQKMMQLNGITNSIMDMKAWTPGDSNCGAFGSKSCWVANSQTGWGTENKYHHLFTLSPTASLQPLVCCLCLHYCSVLFRFYIGVKSSGLCFSLSILFHLILQLK